MGRIDKMDTFSGKTNTISKITIMDRVKKTLKATSIKCFVDYYYIFEQFKDSLSNQEIIDEFKKNNEDWTDNSYSSRACKGKRMFREGLEMDALRYIIDSAKKISPEIKEKAQKIYSIKTTY